MRNPHSISGTARTSRPASRTIARRVLRRANMLLAENVVRLELVEPDHDPTPAGGAARPELRSILHSAGLLHGGDIVPAHWRDVLEGLNNEGHRHALAA